ncbi:MAG TPA: translocation/assembly module TamB domain-containing protein [Oscillatoriaceae cyanobacterium]
MKRGAKWALVVLAVVGVLAAIALGLLSNRSFTTRMAHMAVARFAHQLPANVTFSRVGVNALAGRIEVVDLAIAAPQQPSKPIFRAGKAIVSVDRVDLLHGQLTIRKLQLIDPRATIIHEHGDVYNFDALLPKAQKKQQTKGSTIGLQRLVVSGGRVQYLDPPRRLSAAADHVGADLALDLGKPQAAGQVDFPDGELRFRGHHEALKAFMSRFRFADGNLHLDAFTLQAGQTHLATRGDVTALNTKAPQLRLDGQLSTEIAQFADLVPKEAIAGAVQADLALRGDTQHPRLAATLHGQHLAAHGVSVPALAAQIVATPQSLQIGNLHALLWKGTVDASGRVPLTKRGALDLVARLNGLQLAAARQALAPGRLQGLTGSVTAQVHAVGDALTAQAIQADGHLKVDGQVPLSRRRVPLAGNTDFAWRHATLALDHLRLAAFGGSLAGNARVAPLATTPRYSLDATLDHLGVAAIAAFSPRKLPVSGELSGRVSLAGTGFRQPDLTGSAHLATAVTLGRGAIGNRAALPVQAATELAFQGRRLKIESLHAALLGGRISAHGAVGLSAHPDVALTARLTDVSLAEVTRTFPVAHAPLDGHVSALLIGRGKTFTLETLTAKTLGGTLTGHGDVQLAQPPRYALVAAARNVDLAALNRVFRLVRVPIAGRGSTTMTIVGAGKDFQAEGPLTLSGQAMVPAAVAGAQRALPLRATGNLAVSPSTIGLNPLQLALGDSRLNARGTVDLHGNSALVFDGTVRDAPAIASLFGVRNLQGGAMTLSGRATGTAQSLALHANVQAGPTQWGKTVAFKSASLALNGTLNQRLAIAGSLSARNGSLRGQNFSSLSSPFHYDAPRDGLAKGTLELSDLVAVLPHGRLAGKGSFDLAGKAYTLAVHTTGMSVGGLGSLGVSPPPGLPTSTPIALSASGKGTFASPQLQARIDVGAFTYQGQRYGASQIRAGVQGGRLAVTGQVFAKALGIQGALPLAGSGGTLTLRFANASLAPLLALVPAKGQVALPSSGSVSGTVVLHGPLNRPAQLMAQVDLTTLAVAYPDLTLANNGPIQLQYGGGVLTFQRLRLRGTGTNLSVCGRAGLGTPSDLTFSGTLNLALLEKISPTNFAGAAGTAVVDGQLSGTLGAPDVIGSLTVRNGELSTRNLPEPIHDLNGTVRLANNRVFLDNLSATLGYSGSVQAFGGAQLDRHFKPVNLNLQLSATEVAIKVPKASALVNADLAFSGTPNASRLDGQVQVLQGAYSQDIDLTGGLFKSGGGAPPAYARMPFVRNLALRVQVVSPGQFMVKNNLADGELRADLLVLGTVTRPVIVGRAEAVSGTVTLNGRTYTLQEASVDFIDPNRLKPYVHVIAGTSVQNYDVTVQANGEPKSLKLDMTSTPFLPQQDVLVLLATGQTPQQLGSGGQGFSGAGTFLLNQIGKGVSQQGIVNVLRIQPGSVNPTQATGSSLTVGKRISDKLMVTYSQDLTAANGQTPTRLVTFEYQLTKNVVLNLQQDLNGNFNASARYQFTVR